MADCAASRRNGRVHCSLQEGHDGPHDDGAGVRWHDAPHTGPQHVDVPAPDDPRARLDRALALCRRSGMVCDEADGEMVPNVANTLRRYAQILLELATEEEQGPWALPEVGS